MPTRVRMKPTSVIKARLGIQPNGRVQTFFTKRCAEHMDKYVPFKEGELAYDNRRIETNKVIYNSAYAHYMYEGKVMGPNIPIKDNGIIVGWFSPKGKPKQYTGKDIRYSKDGGHPYAGPYWDERMWSAEKDEVIEEVQNYVNRGGK